MNLDTLKKELIQKDVEVCGYDVDFYNTLEEPNGLWVSLEGGLLSNYIIGEDNPIDEFLEKEGYYLEPYDSGTGLIYPI